MHVTPLNPDFIAHIRAGGPDATGQPAERAISTGTGTPCRACMRNVAAGEPYLLCAARPFNTLNAYTECGPIFLCADECPPWCDAGIPPSLTESPTYILRGYDHEDRIVGGTGGVIAKDAITARAQDLFTQTEVAYIHARSASNNCFLAKIERDDDGGS